MTRRLAIGLTLGATLAAAAPAHAVSVGTLSQVPIVTRPGIGNEIPPEILPGGQRLSWFVTTERTDRCDTPTTDTAASGRTIDCSATGRVVEQTRADYLDHAPSDMPAGREHRRNYYGVYGATHVQTPDGAWHVVEATHGENKNVERGGGYYQNTVFRGPGALVPGCVSGIVGGRYQDCYAAYTAFIGTAVADVDASHDWGLAAPVDKGPAVWPVAGYLTAGGAAVADHGVRHPSIVNGGDGYLYMYYYDDGFAPNSTNAGIRVARSPVSSLGSGWKTWVESRQQWIDSLPRNVHIGADTSAAALALPSPAADSQPLFPSTTTMFAVARVTGRRGFVGIEQGTDFGWPCTTSDGRASFRGFTRLRVSSDGVHWSFPAPLSGPDLESCDFFATSNLTYPRLLNAAGTSTKQVSLDDFDIIGVRWGGTVYRLPVRAPELAAQLPAASSDAIDPARATLSDAVAGPAATTPTPTSSRQPLDDRGVRQAPRDDTPTPDAPPSADVSIKPVAPDRATGLRGRSGVGRVQVRVRTCAPRTTAVRVKARDRWTTVACGRTGTITGLKVGRTYTFVLQAVRIDSRSRIVARGTRQKKRLRIPADRRIGL